MNIKFGRRLIPIVADAIDSALCKEGYYDDDCPSQGIWGNNTCELAAEAAVAVLLANFGELHT